MPGELGSPGRATGGRRYGLGADRRLGNKADFEQLLREGERQSRSGYTFFILMRTSGPARLGVLITRRHAAKATVRNRIKRCVREAFRLEQAGLRSMDVLVRPPYGARPGKAMLGRLRKLFMELPK